MHRITYDDKSSLSPATAAASPPAPAVVRQGLPSEIPLAGEIVASAMTLGRRPLALTQLSAALRRGGPGQVFLSVADNGQTSGIVAAAMATRCAADAALLVGVGHLGRPGDPAATGLLAATVDGLHAQLSGEGIRFIQASWEAHDGRPPFAAFGYRRLAQLDYLCGNINQRPPGALLAPFDASGVFLQPLDPTASTVSRSRWERIVEQTFQATLDCPLLSAFRSPADVVASYVDAPTFDATAWWVIGDASQDVGCLILTPHQDGEVMELTYMGIVPARRGRSWGAKLFGHAMRLAAERGAEQLMLAVDRQNGPAVDLYRQQGLETVGSEAVWGRGLAMHRTA